MRADVLQAVALCCHGNAYLARGEGHPAPELLGHNRAFGGVEEVIFERTPMAFGRQGATIPVADATAPWLRRLAHEGVFRLELKFSKCNFDPSKREPGSWGIVSDGDVGLEIWQPVRKARVVHYGEPPVWRVRYSSQRTQRWSLGTTIDLERARAMLASGLQEALAFASEGGGMAMRVALERCFDLHKAASSEMLGFDDVTPEPLPEQNHKLLASATRALVVIGSHAWDRSAVAEHNQCRFELTTQLLWKCSLTAFEAAVNTRATASESLKQAV